MTSAWQRLDARMLAVTPLRQLAGFLPVIAVVLVIGAQQDLGGRIYGLLVGVLVVVLAGVLRWLTTRYRITSERVELRSGLLFRNARSVPRDRIRSVDVTAGPVHRLFGLSVVTIGTGERSEGVESRELTLDAVSAAEADRMRQRLLNAVDAGAAGPNHLGVSAPPAPTELAALDWSWLRFAPLTVSSLVAVGAVAGAVGQLVGEFGADVADLGGVRDQLSVAPLWLGVSAVAVLVLVIALLGSVLIFVEAWWGFRLVREPGGTLRIRRGLLTTRSVSLEERRVRGVEVVEPLLLRVGRGARTVAVATGLGGRRSHGRGTLLPPAPRDEAHRVSGAVLIEEPSPTRMTLRRHPPEALRRRLVRAVLPVLAGSAVLWLAPVPVWLAWATLGLLPVTVLLAVDAYRNLGHALTSRYLVTRHGAGMRTTVALQRSGVIGWTVSQSFFQRRAGLVTVTATTAAGGGAYHVIDVRTADGLAVAEHAVPGLLTPFLNHDVAAPAAH
ncbi:MAG TPA: PH domain-containing protein [Pseudonocardiaceae bacterium]|nr:PH domain-containing protein [Pseudonocardiaceae bacterium]